MNNSLSPEEIYDRYGHGLTESQIMSLYPLDTGELKKEYGGQEYTVTYDLLTAYALRQKYPVVEWGKLRKNHRTFVFKKSRPVVEF